MRELPVRIRWRIEAAANDEPCVLGGFDAHVLLQTHDALIDRVREAERVVADLRHFAAAPFSDECLQPMEDMNGGWMQCGGCWGCLLHHLRQSLDAYDREEGDGVDSR